MNLMKNRKIIYLIFYIAFLSTFLFGALNNQSETNIIDLKFIKLSAKAQCNNWLSNFVFLLTNNIAIEFVLFWLNFWTYGIIGTIFLLSSSFAMGLVSKLLIELDLFYGISFVLLELVVSAFVFTKSLDFRLLKTKIEYDHMIKIFKVVSLLLIVAALIEVFVIERI